MKSPESYINEVMMPHQSTGRDFLVKFFVSEGYAHQCKQHNKAAVYRLEIYNHLFEPQESEYYCVDCAPPIPLAAYD